MFKGTFSNGCALLMLAMFSGCASPTQESIEFPIRATSNLEAQLVDDGVQITLTRAILLFGPVYFCASRGASYDLCPEARAEFLPVVEVDLLNNQEVFLGMANGVSGSIESLMFDYGHPWLIASADPIEEPRSSLLLEGVMDSESDTLGAVPFRLSVTLQPDSPGAPTISGIQTSVVLRNGIALQVGFDAAAWARSIRWAELVARGTSDGVPVTLLGVEPSRTALVQSLGNAALPRFEWSDQAP